LVDKPYRRAIASGALQKKEESPQEVSTLANSAVLQLVKRKRTTHSNSLYLMIDHTKTCGRANTVKQIAAYLSDHGFRATYFVTPVQTTFKYPHPLL
jgi:hypothetical protein